MAVFFIAINISNIYSAYLYIINHMEIDFLTCNWYESGVNFNRKTFIIYIEQNECAHETKERERKRNWERILEWRCSNPSFSFVASNGRLKERYYYSCCCFVKYSYHVFDINTEHTRQSLIYDLFPEYNSNKCLFISKYFNVINNM